MLINSLWTFDIYSVTFCGSHKVKKYSKNRYYVYIMIREMLLLQVMLREMMLSKCFNKHWCKIVKLSYFYT